jgi:two-component system chemotaxis response regulator CheB
VTPVELVAIGASLGGLTALELLLSGLPDTMPPIAIVQHRRTDEDGRLSQLLQSHTALTVVEPDDKTSLAPGHVYVAPSDYHLLVEVGTTALSTDAAVRFARPSIDVLFESVARSYGPRAIAVVLTSSSDDGVEGAIAVRRAGGLVVVQDPRSAASPVLPAAVIERAGADRVLHLEEIAAWLTMTCASRMR